MKLDGESAKKKNIKKTAAAVALVAVLAALVFFAWRGARAQPAEPFEPFEQSVAPASVESAAPASNEYDKLAEAIEKNPDVVGWLTLGGADIDDPVVQAADNDFYLRRRWDEAGYDVWGCYFLDYINVTDGETLFDRVSIIYGHALDDYIESEKFSKLKRYQNADFCKANPTFSLTLTRRALEFEVFAAGKIPIGYDYIDPNPDDAKLRETLDYMLANSYCDFGVELEPNDTFLFLSTCTSDENVRYVVAARRIA